MSPELNPETIERLWQQVLATALLGTDRQPFALPQAEGALGDLLSRLDSSDPEGALLSAAAMLGYMRHVGKLPVAPLGRALPPPCPPDPQPAASRQAAELVRQFDPQAYHTFKEWLHLAFKHGVRAPEECLPELLTYTKHHAAPLCVLVVGVRGRWLAELVGNIWEYAAFQPEDDSVWRTGTQTQRETYLAILRQTDPERARQLLEEAWEREPADQRRSFLYALDSDFSEADRPFLSRVAQTDPDDSVRGTATMIINRLDRPSTEQREADVLPIFDLDVLWGMNECRLLEALTHDWSADFSLRFAESLPRILSKSQYIGISLYYIDRYVPHLHPQALLLALKNLEAHNFSGKDRKQAEKCIDTLRTRIKINEAF